MSPIKKLINIFISLLIFTSIIKPQDSLKYYKVNKINITNIGLTDLYLTKLKFVNDIMEFFHTRTRESTIRNGLLFSENDTVNSISLGESERLLRDYTFLRNVKISIDTSGIDSITASVFVAEKISRTYNMAFGSTKKTRLGLWVDEENFFGYGKSLTLGYDHQSGEGKKDNYSIIYNDRQLFNSHWYSSFQYKELPFENIGTIYLSKPFLSDGQNANLTFYGSQAKVHSPIFEDGKVVATQNYDEWTSNIYFAYKLTETPITRVSAGSYNIWTNYQTQESYFDFNKNYNFVFISLQLLSRKYSKETKVNRLYDYEDIPLGTNITIAFAKQIHSGNNYADYRFMFNIQHALFSNGFYFGALHILKSDVANKTTCNTSNLSQFNMFYRYNIEFITAIRVINYTSTNQPIGYDKNVTLGETNGLPGFAENYFNARNLMLANWENRYPFTFTLWFMRFASFTSLNIGTVYNSFEELNKTKFYKSAGIGFHIDNEVIKGRQLTSIALIYNFDLPSKYSIYLTTKLSFDFFQYLEFMPF